MRLVSNQLFDGDAGGGNTLPVETIVNNNRLWHYQSIITLVHHKVFLRGVQVVAVNEVVFIPDFGSERLSVWVNEKLVRIESQAICGVVITIDLVAIKLAGLEAGNKYVPDIIAFFFNFYNVTRLSIRPIEKQQENFFGVLRKNGEIDALGRQSRAEGIIIPGRNMLIGLMFQYIRHLQILLKDYDSFIKFVYFILRGDYINEEKGKYSRNYE